MATYKNLRFCEVLHGGTYYDVLVGVSNLDEVNDILQEWALTSNGPGEALNLPQELIKNQDITDILTSKDVNNFVYVKSASTGYMNSPYYAGVVGTFPTLPKILVASKYVVPACVANLWSTATFSGVFSGYNIDSASFTLVENEVNYIGIDYNSGEPQYTLYTNQSSFNYSSIVPVCAVLYFNSELSVIPMGSAGNGLPEKLLLNQQYRKEFDIITDFTLAEGAERYVELSALTVSNGVTTIALDAVDTESAENDMWLWYKDATSAWQRSASDQINNSQYQGDGIGLQSLTAGEFVINYIYRVIDDENLVVFNVLSKNFASLAEAKDSDMITDLPDAIKEGCVLVGRFIIEQGTDVPTVQKIQRVNPFATVS